jgi:hypothetical protein
VAPRILRGLPLKIPVERLLAADKAVAVAPCTTTISEHLGRYPGRARRDNALISRAAGSHVTKSAGQRPAEVNSVEWTALEMVSLVSRLNWMIPTSKNIKH